MPEKLQRRPRGGATGDASERHTLQRDSASRGAQIDATVAYVACRSPISDPFARFTHAEKMKRDAMVQNHHTYFRPWETIHESNPREILERKEKVNLVPLLIMQGALDDNVLPSMQEKCGDHPESSCPRPAARARLRSRARAPS